jgi:hypothetical protein
MATKKPAQTVIVGGTPVTVPSQAGIKKPQSTQSLVDSILKQGKAIQSKGKAAVSETKALGQQATAAAAGAQNAVRGFAAATGSDMPSAPANIPFAGGMRQASPSDSPVIGITAPQFLPPAAISADRRDAFAMLEDTFRQYGLEALTPVIQGYMRSDIGPYEASLKLKNEQIYKDRFKGNELRRAAGLNVLSEAEYLNQENTYKEVFKSYNQMSLMGADTKSQRDFMANMMAQDLSPYEVKNRFDVATERVTNADPAVKAQLKTYYGLTDDKMVSFVLAPEKTLSDIQQQITTAEIGSAASQAGLGVTQARATELAKYGVDLQEARAGYNAIASGLPRGQKLAAIYGDTYTQQMAEEDVFKGVTSAGQQAIGYENKAANKRKRFASLERAAFGGQTGVTQGALGTSGRGSF